MVSGDTPRSLKGRSSAETRSAVLDLIRSSESVSRTELAQRSSLTEATISKIVKQLLGEGIIIEAGHAESTGGKRPTLLTLNTGVLYAIGIALDQSSIVIVLCGLNGTMVERVDIAGAGVEAPPLVVGRVWATVSALLDARGIDRRSIVGMGVSTTGRRLGPLGWYFNPTETDIWERFDTQAELERLGGIRVMVENDANCAALGTFWAQTDDPQRDFMTVYMSKGIGAGIVIGGTLYRGASGNAGEIGHIVVEEDGLPCWCGSRGCLETYGPPRGVVRQVRGDESLRDRFAVGDVDDETVYRAVLDAVLSGDAVATALVDHAARNVAVVLRGLMNALDLDRIQLAGPGFADVGQRYLHAITDALHSSFTRGLRSIDVTLGSVGSEVAAMGAASVVLHSSLTPHRVSARG